MVGIYRGAHSEEPENEFDVEIKTEYILDHIPSVGTTPYLYNINNNCTAKGDRYYQRVLEVKSGYRNMSFVHNTSFDSTYSCYLPRGWVSLNQTWDTLKINYSIRLNTTTEERKEYHFTGIRIQ